MLGLNLPLRSLGLTHYSLAQRNLDFRSRTAAELAEVLVRGAVGITLAAGGSGPWSLVLGYLAGTATWSAALWLLVDWRPSPRAPRAPLPPLMRFGGALTGVSFIGVVMSYADNFFVGRVLGTAALGLYTLGYRLPEMLVVEVAAAAGLVMFPAFALLEGAALRRALIATSRYSMLIMLPLAVALFTLAHPLVLALFGPRWLGAVPVVRILSIAFMTGPTGQVSGNAFMATRRVDVMLKLAIPQGILLIVLLAIFGHRGIAAVAGCQAVGQVAVRADRPLRLHARARPAGERALERVLAGDRRQRRDGGRDRPARARDPRALGALAACGVLGGATYAALAWLFARDALRDLWALARPRLAV